jgi:nitrogen fixation/metabolism regulation signal transduction histidine kinase
MILNRFFINVVVRVALITISCVVLGVVLQHLDHGYYYTLAGMIFVIILQSCILVGKVNKTNSDLEKFFSSVQNHDSSIRMSEDGNNDSFRKLHDKMNSVNTIIQNVKIENERTAQFLQSIVDHVDIGLLSFDIRGRTEIYNKAAIKYLKVQQLSELSLLKSVNDELYKIITSIKPGQEVLYKIKTDNLVQSVLVKAIELRYENNLIKLVSFQDITNELDKKELQSWQRLIRVLTHEIMNSISPITSLTAVISGYFKKKNGESQIQSEAIDNEIVSKTLSGLNTIEETGKGLLDFVDKYRSLTSLPKPNLCRFLVDSLFVKCKCLMGSNISDNIEIIESVSPADLAIEADFAQMEQILINLIKNSAEALPGRKNGIIHLNAFRADDSTIIQVEDNGTGIPGEIIEDIFVPFFTTKKSGSGIGLSLSKQIMQNHNGSISVNSMPTKGARFTLKFPGYGV